MLSDVVRNKILMQVLPWTTTKYLQHINDRSESDSLILRFNLLLIKRTNRSPNSNLHVNLYTVFIYY